MNEADKKAFEEWRRSGGFTRPVDAGEEDAWQAALEYVRQPSEPVASIYITPCGEREFDDWKHDLPVGRNTLYTHPAPAVAHEPVAGWIQFVDGKQTQNFCRDKYEMQAIDKISRLMNKTLNITYQPVYTHPAPAVAQEPITVLPDGSAFAVMSFPLPKDHWLYAERQYQDGEYEPVELGKPILTHAVRDAVVSAVRYAVRGATNCGKDVDFDPDALVQNAVYALCGPYSKPKPKQDDLHAPAVAQPPADVVRELVEKALGVCQKVWDTPKDQQNTVRDIGEIAGLLRAALAKHGGES